MQRSGGAPNNFLHLTKEALKAPFNSTTERRFLHRVPEPEVPAQTTSEEFARLRQQARNRGKTNVFSKSMRFS